VAAVRRRSCAVHRPPGNFNASVLGVLFFSLRSTERWRSESFLPNVATVVSNLPVPPLPQIVVHAPPQVVYHEPRVVERAPRVVYQPAPVIVYRPAPVVYGPYWKHGQPHGRYTRWDRDGDGIPNHRDRRDDRWQGPNGDRDRDGIPNRYDRRDDRPYAQGPYGDRDRDGIPNRQDRRDDRKWRH